MICSVFCASVTALCLAADQKTESPAGRQAWSESPYLNFRAPQPVLGGRILVSDEADDPALPAELARVIRPLQAELHDLEGWRTPFANGDPLRIFVARKDAGGVRRLSSRSLERGRLVEPAIQIDGSAMSDAEIASEAARLYALATLSAYEAPDRTFLTAAVADFLSSDVRPEPDGEDALMAAAAPTVDLAAQSAVLGRRYVEEFARVAGGGFALRAIWEKAAETGQEVMPLFLAAYSEAAGKAEEDQLLLRFAARLYSAVEPEAGPSRIGLFDLQTGALDGSSPTAFALRHRSYLPGAEAPSAFRLFWPEAGASAAAVVRYRDSALPPDVVFLAPGSIHSIALAGVARIDWLVAGSSGPAAASAMPVNIESLSGFPYAGLVAHASGGAEGSRVWWTTASHESLAGWAIFREEVQPDGRIARTGPDILPASDHGEAPLQYVFVDPNSSPGTFYRYTVWAVTEDGTLARAFAATLRTVD